jgi:hypothetical protein
MAERDRRKDVRINRHFAAEVLKQRTNYGARGTTEDISLGGAFVKTEDWRAFQINEQTLVTFILPPVMSGMGQPVGLRGSAVITRVDEEREGIALQFTKNFKQFDKVHNLEVAGEARYKKLAYFLSLATQMETGEFLATHPNGFLLETSLRALDKNVLFQFQTGSLHDEYSMEQATRGEPKISILEARVIEIKKKKLDAAANTITIGRAAINDIVLYNSLVSKSHAHLHLHPSGEICFLCDTGSKNGTFVNGKPLKPYEKYQLVDRDEVSIGPQTRMVYLSSMAFNAFLEEIESFCS